MGDLTHCTQPPGMTTALAFELFCHVGDLKHSRHDHVHQGNKVHLLIKRCTRLLTWHSQQALTNIRSQIPQPDLPILHDNELSKQAWSRCLELLQLFPDNPAMLHLIACGV